MRTPIAHALAWPERHDSGVSALDFMLNNQLSFELPSYDRFPCLRLAYEALQAKGTAPAILNAANEVAVEAFLTGDISFTAIPKLIEKTLTNSDVVAVDSIDTVLQADAATRKMATQFMELF